MQGGTGPKTGGYQAEGATKRELIMEATLIARMVITSAFSDRTEFSVTTTGRRLTENLQPRTGLVGT
jgi:hypothetical protein